MQILRVISFNPCFIGSISEAGTATSVRLKEVRVSILVLLEVSLRPQRKRFERAGEPSFNPCFIGSISEAVQKQKDKKWVKQFQSLFYWKYL